ncbi:RET2 [[Candida] subhashii]|uniref:Coatomer subunit delta n=1 Tax=[Candida] subhashii TaxID=561895 RepID=A0A8J5QNP8_9ASCO|nr:RET2 [[Candida] subhashii]KAG7663735.1 RET2 [[Candida] subhashii]
MVVLAASICTRGGKALLSRQFREISRDRITALLANFPSLISNSSSQHTTVEDENVRYVYQPLEELYIVLITNKSSNILQDIDTLHLFASTVSNLLRNVDEREIFDNSFEIISAFDEIITLGFKENLTLSQVQNFLEMDSHEEKIQEIIERNKELEATEERKRRAKEIQRKELAKRNMEQFPTPSSNFGGYDQSSQQQQTYQPTYQPTPIVETSHGSNSLLASKPISRGGGLQLGKKASGARPARSTHLAGTSVAHGAGGAHEPLLATHAPVFSHNKVPPVAVSTPTYSENASPAATPTPSSAATAAGSAKVQNHGILITINEKVNAQLARDGSVVSSEVKGDLQLRINNQSLANAKVLLNTGDKKQYKTHPNVDRNLFNTSNVITVKDKSKTFPANDQPLGVLRWRSIVKQDSKLTPILITPWVNIQDSGVAQVTLEYELSPHYIDSHPSGGDILENVKILVPIVTNDVHLQEGGNDDVSYEIGDQGVIFTIGSISIDDPQGSFDFSIVADDEESLFPLELQFDIFKTGVDESDVSLGGISVIDVVANTEDEEPLPFELHSNVSSESYIVQ